MPRKKQGMPFEVHPSPMKDENGKNLLYIKPLSGRKITMKEIDHQWASSHAMKDGELIRAVDAALEHIIYWMTEGYRIETPIGTFEPKLRLKQPKTETDKVRSDDAELQGIDFMPSKKFEKTLKIKISRNGFRYIRRPDSSSLMRNEQYLIEALQKSIKANNGYTTVNSFATYSGLTVYSARKRLNSWCHGEHPMLQCSHFGHLLIYTEI